MHHHRRHRDPAPPPRLQLSPLFARIAMGGTIAVAVLSAGLYVFIPLSDLSAQQLAAGPGNALAAAVLAHTGRSSGSAAEQRQTAAASTPIAKVARRDTPDP